MHIVGIPIVSRLERRPLTSEVELRRGLLSAALKTKGLEETDGCFELSVGNPDKGQLPLDEIKRRVAQFVEQGLPLVVTRVSIFSIITTIWRLPIS